MFNITNKPLLVLLGLPKTVWFNLRYLPWRQAVRLPVWVSHRVWLLRMGGRVSVSEGVGFGRVQIGFSHVGVFDQVRCRSIWEVSGEVDFEGACGIAHGCKISVTQEGHLILGEGCSLNAESTIYCCQRVAIGAGAMVSWQVQVMDSDLHKIMDAQTGRRLNADAPVSIGERVWLGSRAMVCKGTRIAAGSIVAAGAVCSGELGPENAIFAGVPARLLREGVVWER